MFQVGYNFVFLNQRTLKSILKKPKTNPWKQNAIRIQSVFYGK